MLVKSLKNEEKNGDFAGFRFPVCDSHLHLVQCAENEDVFLPYNYFCATSVHSVSEWKKLEELNVDASSVKKTFGFHPQKPDFDEENAFGFLKTLLDEGKLDAIGEAGFDFFTPEIKENRKKQEEAFNLELNFAFEYGKPLVIHERKALEMIYKYAKELSRLPSVLFHSFFYGFYEAESLLAKGINAYFSFGKQILNGNKKACECVVKLPENRLLLETDAPYQTLKGEAFTSYLEILKVYRKAMELRSYSENFDDREGVFERAEQFALQLKNNFNQLYGRKDS